MYSISTAHFIHGYEYVSFWNSCETRDLLNEGESESESGNGNRFYVDAIRVVCCGQYFYFHTKLILDLFNIAPLYGESNVNLTLNLFLTKDFLD